MYKLIRATLILAGIFIGLLGLQFCKSDENTMKTVPKNEKNKTKQKDQSLELKNILFFGNSLTAGYGLNEDQSFPSIIQNYIDSLELKYNVINGGLSGETTSGGKERIGWVLKQPIDIFVLELGANDMLRGLDLTATKSNLDIILSKVKQKYPHIKIALAEMKAAPNMGGEYINAFSDIYTDLAKTHGITLIPFFLEGVVGNPLLTLPDGKHPNAEGQKIAANNIWTTLKHLL